MDGLKVWLKLGAKFNGGTNVLHQTIQFLKYLDCPYSPNISGVMLGYIDQILHILNQLDDDDPSCIHHVRYNDQQKMSLILRQRSDFEPYACITYNYYMQITVTNMYNVEKYVDVIFNNAMYEAWSIGYEQSLIAGNAYNANGVLKTIVDPGAGQPVQTTQVVPLPAVTQTVPVVATTTPVVTAPEPRVPRDP
jgi:hypothetical protein